MKDSEIIENFLRYLRECETNLKMAQEDLSQSDKETQDVLHRLELCDDSYRSTALIAKMLRTVRRERRIAKDRTALLLPIKEWCGANVTAIRNLEALLGEIRKIERQQQIRVYIPRTEILEGFDNESEKKL